MIADEIRAQRARRRLKQEQVSAATGIPLNTLSKIERVLTAIDAEQIDKIAAAFGMLPEELWASARASAAARAETRAEDEVYDSCGKLLPTETRSSAVDRARLEELASKRSPFE